MGDAIQPSLESFVSIHLLLPRTLPAVGLFIVSTPSGWGSLKKVLWTFLFCIHPQCSWPESVRELVQVRETGLNCQTMMGLEADVSEL